MTTARVAILISGGGSNMVSLLKAMEKADFNAKPVLVFSNVPGCAGLERANEFGVPTAALDHRDFAGDRIAFEDRLHAKLEEFSPSVICLAGFMRVLSPSFVRRWQGKMLNIHPSLLPKYPGLNTHKRAIENGDKEAGCTVHIVTEELDGC